MIKVEIDRYTGKYSHLNTKGFTNLKVNQFEIARALIKIGNKGWSSTLNRNKYKLLETFLKSYAYLSSNKHGNLVINEEYLNSNKSEKGTLSFFFGQALTQIYAEKILNINWLLHLDDKKSSISLTPKSTAKRKFSYDSSTSKLAISLENPDFLGLSGDKKWHILESKGSTSKSLEKKVIQKALDQASRVNSIDGQPISTNTACYFRLLETGILGTIIDPPSDDTPRGIEIKIDNIEYALKKYYSFFLENTDNFERRFEINNNSFELIKLGYENYYLGCDIRIIESNNLFNTISKLHETYGDRLYYKEEKTISNLYKHSYEFSLGNDGIMLLKEEYI